MPLLTTKELKEKYPYKGVIKPLYVYLQKLRDENILEEDKHYKVITDWQGSRILYSELSYVFSIHGYADRYAFAHSVYEQNKELIDKIVAEYYDKQT